MDDELICTKQRFASPAAAKRKLRAWQRHSRRTSFAGLHAYPCPYCRGWYHLGHGDEGELKRRSKPKRDRRIYLDFTAPEGEDS